MPLYLFELNQPCYVRLGKGAFQTPFRGIIFSKFAVAGRLRPTIAAAGLRSDVLRCSNPLEWRP